LLQAVDLVFQKLLRLTSIRLLSEIHLTSVVCGQISAVGST
jgi:hypothetical protein